MVLQVDVVEGGSGGGRVVCRKGDNVAVLKGMSQTSERSESEDGGGDFEEGGEEGEGGGGGGKRGDGEVREDRGGPKRKKMKVAGVGTEGEGQGDSSTKREHQRRHTQISRAKLNSKFNELLELVQPLYKVDPKHAPHRSEVLDYAIRAFNDLTERKIYLETELALSSNESLNAYVRSAVQSNASLTRILEGYLAMVCAKKQWRYAELWCPNTQRNALRLSGTSIHRTVVGEELRRVECFRDASADVEIRPPADLIGRVYHTLRTEWMNDLSDPEVFTRSAAVQASNMK